jgi:hypothetical protein
MRAVVAFDRVGRILDDHGIVMSNPFTETTNCTLKDDTARLELVEFGGRPMFYFHSKFLEGNKQWMGAPEHRNRCLMPVRLSDRLDTVNSEQQAGENGWVSVPHMTRIRRGVSTLRPVWIALLCWTAVPGFIGLRAAGAEDFRTRTSTSGSQIEARFAGHEGTLFVDLRTKGASAAPLPDWPAMNLIGVRGYSSDRDKGGTWIEKLSGVVPPDLHEAQCARRLSGRRRSHA